MSSILNIAAEAADICAVQRPTDLFSNSSQNDILFASIAKQALSSLMRHADWQCLTREAVFDTVLGQTDYLIETIAPDFHSLINASIYAADDARNIIGAVSEERWSKEKQYHRAEIDLLFKIQNNMIRFVKDPGKVCVHFSYKSNAVCIDALSGTPKSQITSNADVPVFDEYLVKLGMIWRFQKRSGLDYAEEYNEYQRELNKSYAQTKAPGNISLAYGSGALWHDTNGGVIVNAVSSGQ